MLNRPDFSYTAASIVGTEIWKRMVREKKNLRELYYRANEFRPSKADAKRIAILEEAIKCLATDGIHDFSIQHIAKNLKLRRSHVVYYYATAAELAADALRMILALGQDITVAHLSSIKNSADMLDGYVEATFLWFHLHPEHAGVLFLMCHLSTVSESEARWLKIMRESSEQRIADIIKRQRYGKSLGEKVLSLKAYQIRGLIMGNLLNYFTSKPNISYDQLQQITIKSVRALARER